MKILEITPSKHYYSGNIKQKKQIQRKTMKTNFDKHLAKRKALANRQYKKRRELKELDALIIKYEEELKKEGGIPSKRFIYNQNRRIEKRAKMLLEIRKNTEKLIALDALIKEDRAALNWDGIVKNRELRKKLESLLKDVEELRKERNWTNIIVDNDLRSQLDHLYFLTQKLIKQ